MKKHHIPFISVEDDDDLIVSFAMGEYATDSLILLRTPKYEIFLPEEERGVSVGTGDPEESTNNFLISIDWGQKVVKLESSARHYVLDIQSVPQTDINAAKRVLGKMNFDNSFTLKMSNE